MGAGSSSGVTVRNQTPYVWNYELGKFRGVLQPWQNVSREVDDDGTAYLVLTFEGHPKHDFRYGFSTEKNPTFLLLETYDREEIGLQCSTESTFLTCPNYGVNEEDSKEQQLLEEIKKLQQEEQHVQEEEERQHQERSVRNRRIQQEIEKEGEGEGKRLARARERLQRKLNRKGRQNHRQRTQRIEDDAAEINRDESGDLEQKFIELMVKYQITEDENLQHDTLENRIRILQNELTLNYFGDPKLSIWCQFTLDQAMSQGKHSLTERFSILKAVAEVTLTQDLGKNISLPDSDKKYDFLQHLLEQLYCANPTIAQQIIQSILTVFINVSEEIKCLVSQIIFNKIWTPKEILLFLRGSSGMDQEQTAPLLHTVQTSRVDLLSTLSALNKKDPVKYLQGCVEAEKDKDVDTILNEMREENYPEKILIIMEDVLNHLKENCTSADVGGVVKMEAAKKLIKSMDLTNPDPAVLKEVLLFMSLVVHQTKGWFPRHSQVAALVMLLLPQYALYKKNVLLEIGTGEGKSCIIAMFATIQALRGIKVDLLTSSPVLARRDQEEWRELYEKFGVTSSAVPPPYKPGCSTESRNSRLQEAYSKQLVYGTVSSLAADTLRQEFEKDTTRGKRKFDMAIVDEVDYMTLDNGVQMTYLSHEASGLRHIEQVLAAIWSIIATCQPFEMKETGDIEWTTAIQHFHKAAKLAVIGPETSDEFTAFDLLLPGVQLGFYSEEDVDKFMKSLAEVEKQGEGADRSDVDAFMDNVGVPQQCDLLTILESALENTVSIESYSLTDNKAALVGEKKVNTDPDVLECRMLLLDKGLAGEIMSDKQLIEATVAEVRSTIKYSNDKDVQTESSSEESKFLVVPSFLEKYLESRLPAFVENALKAIMMTQGREYMVEHSIIPVDFQASGVLEKNKRWGDGLQQFLEMKHQLEITPLSNVTNFLSNFYYIKRYLKGNGIVGVSGTLGGKADKEFLERNYKTDSYAVPAHRHKKVVEFPALQVSGKDQWRKTICETAQKVADRGQAVLIICGDVKTANELQDEMQRTISDAKITMYTISDEHNVENTRFSGGNIIISTNLGGRGTDIKLDSEVNQCGGLFVLLTHFPRSLRVEKQAFGRTGRKGNPGMVQMILCTDHLASAYQGQTVEVMRQLREEYEVDRITDMETDELLEIQMKEDLFDTFCKFLQAFDRNFSDEERGGKLPTSKLSRFDYEPAINALRETWALWLILHEEHINRHDNVDVLKTDLLTQMKETQKMLLSGQSSNFYDHIKQAIGRTELHCRNKTKSDYGAKAHWKETEMCDPFYSAIALYNQAYITINLAPDKYITEARDLLKKAKEKTDAFLSETTNTMISCQTAAKANFKPHDLDEDGVANLTKQMESRLNIFKAWNENIDLAVGKLDEFEKSNDDGITELSTLLSLSDDKDEMTRNELMKLYECGLFILFEVKKKPKPPKFCWDALICFFMGVCQVLVGVLVIALSFGSATNFGMGLISEGVSDMIDGVQGMITGSFSWVAWAINKAISIGMSLLSGGLSMLKKVGKAAYRAIKGVVKGTKSLMSVADDIIKTGAKTFKSIQGAARSMAKEALPLVTKKVAIKESKEGFKYAAKFALQEVGKQVAIEGVQYAIDEGTGAVFKEIVKAAFQSSITELVKGNVDLARTINEFICSVVPKSALDEADYKIDEKRESGMKKSMELMTKGVIPEIMTDLSRLEKVFTRLKQASDATLGLIGESQKKAKGFAKAVSFSLEVAKYTTALVSILESIPTKEVIDESFVPKLKEAIEMEREEERLGKYEKDGREDLPDVIRIKTEFIGLVAKGISGAFIKACAGCLTRLVGGEFKKKAKAATGKAVGKILGRQKTETFLKGYTKKSDTASSKSAEKAVPETPKEAGLSEYVDAICRVLKKPTQADMFALTKTKVLNGQGIQMIVVDDDGKVLSEESYPGSDHTIRPISLRLTKDSKGEDGIEYSGHFDIVNQDGTISPVKSQDTNSLYHAIAQATSNGSEEENASAAVNLQNKVKEAINADIEGNSDMVKTIKAYDEMQKTSRKYTIGLVVGNKAKDEDAEQYLEDLKPMKKTTYGSSTITEYDIAVNYNLGNTASYTSLSGDNKPVVNKKLNKAIIKAAIPPILNRLTMRVHKHHHRDALTSGGSREADKCRSLILDKIMLLGGKETLLKASFIMAHPLASRQIRNYTGNPKPASRLGCVEMSDDSIACYYRTGYRQLLNKYHSTEKIIDQNQRDNLQAWVEKKMFLDQNTQEYKDILAAVNSVSDDEPQKPFPKLDQMAAEIREESLNPDPQQKPEEASIDEFFAWAAEGCNGPPPPGFEGQAWMDYAADFSGY